ncbi:hypothetical protein LINPERHAP2_LOCUS15216 [Linum perenne]
MQLVSRAESGFCGKSRKSKSQYVNIRINWFILSAPSTGVIASGSQGFTVVLEGSIEWSFGTSSGTYISVRVGRGYFAEISILSGRWRIRQEVLPLIVLDAESLINAPRTANC